MTPATLAELLAFFHDFGIVGMLVVIIGTGRLGWWVWARELDAARAERDEWRRIALMGSDASRRAADVAASMMGRPPQ